MIVTASRRGATPLRRPALLVSRFHDHERTGGDQDRSALRSSGVGHAVPEGAEGIIQLSTAVLQGVGASDSDIETLVADFRRDDDALMQTVQAT
ncbi:MAG: hypothetical protein QNJ30_23630 [Kiloniellales bacterium]|nr:hypothetical protein [Kiloniellales bacterium]